MAIYILNDTTDTVPRSTTLTGTLTASTISRVVEGSGTAFLSEIRAGDYLFDENNPQIIEVDWVKSDTELWLKTPVATAIAGSAKATIGSKRQISVIASGDTITTVDADGNSGEIPAGLSINPQEEDTVRGTQPIILTVGSAASAICLVIP